MKKIKVKKLFMGFILGLGIATTSVLGYATVTYVLNRTVDQVVTVGETAIYTDGLFVELTSLDHNTLTFFELEETDTQKHYVTYVYTYEVLVPGLDIIVSSVNDNIVVSDLTSTDTTISITFSLNQELEYNEGDILNVQFYFEAVAPLSVNMNDTTIEQLMSIGFSEAEATSIIAYSGVYTNLADVYINNDVVDAITRFEHLVVDGTIVFE